MKSLVHCFWIFCTENQSGGERWKVFDMASFGILSFLKVKVIYFKHSLCYLGFSILKLRGGTIFVTRRGERLENLFENVNYFWRCVIWGLKPITMFTSLHVLDPFEKLQSRTDHTQIKQVPDHRSIPFIILSVSWNVRTNKLALI